MKTALLLWVFCLVWIAGCGDSTTPSTFSSNIKDYLIKPVVGRTQTYVRIYESIDTFGVRTTTSDTIVWKVLATGVQLPNVTAPVLQFSETQINDKGIDTDIQNYLRVTDTELRYYFTASASDADAIIRLKAPIAKGTTWLDDILGIMHIEETGENLSLPAGSFSTIRVEQRDTTHSSNGMTTQIGSTKSYYATDVLIAKILYEEVTTYKNSTKSSKETITAKLVSVK